MPGVMKNDDLHLPDYYDIYGQHSCSVPQKGIRVRGNKKYASESESLHRRHVVSFVSSAEYLDSSLPGLFRCTAADLSDLCMDNDDFLSCFEGENHTKENCRGSAGADRSGSCFDVMPCAMMVYYNLFRYRETENSKYCRTDWRKEKKQMKKMEKRMIVLVAAVMMLLAFIPISGVQTVHAADDPEKIEEIYEKDGVFYYNTGSNSFARNQNQYLKEILGNGSNELVWNEVQSGYGRSMSDLWLEVAAGLMVGRDDQTAPGYFPVSIDKASRQNSDSEDFQLADKLIHTYRYDTEDMKSSDMQSLKKAEEFVYRSAGIGAVAASTGYFRNNADEQTVVAAAIKAAETDSNYRVAAVYFTNFKVITLFPNDTGNNYVTTMTKNDTSYSDPVASTVRNNTGSTANGSQKVSNSYTASMESSVNGSETYTYQESITVGNEFAQGFFNKFKVEVNFTASQAFQKGWSESEGVSYENGSEQSVSVELPPYTNVMIQQKTTDAEAETRYNCPVGVTFDAVVVLYDKGGVYKVNNTPAVFEFNNSARKSLGTRYYEWKDEVENRDDEGILWSWITHFDIAGGTNIREAVEKATTYVPIAPTGAMFRQKVKLVASEIDGLMPILPLRKVRVDSLNIPRYEDHGSYDDYNYLAMKMTPGSSTYTYYFSLSGYNAADFPYFGFSPAAGTWKVVDENGLEWTGADAPVKMGSDSVSGYQTINAVKPGVCFLKYYIDDDIYNTSTDPDHYTDNDELTTTAVIKVTVTDERTISVNGEFEGYVDESPEALDADGKLHASVCDESGKEIDADVTWEKKEKDGIHLDGNMVSFTKPGTYHVCACSDGIKSDWVEITAKYRTFDVTFKPGNGRKEEKKTVRSNQEVSAPSIEPGKCEAFTGWFRDAACTQEADLPLKVTEDLVLYGGWEDKHSLKEIGETEATCEKDGNVAHFACDNCGKLFSDQDARTKLQPEAVVIPGGHKLIRTKKKAAACTETGNIEYYTCSVCGGIFGDKNGTEELSEGETVLKALGHDWTEWETVKEPSEHEAGEQACFCRNDPSHTKTRTVPALGHKHTMIKTLKKAPTCTEEGNILYYTCKECGWVFTDSTGNEEISPEDTVLPAAGHEWDEGIVTQEPTEKEEGQKKFTCTVCGTTKTEAIPAEPKADTSTQEPAAAQDTSQNTIVIVMPGTSETEANEAQAPDAAVQEKTILSRRSDADMEGSVYGLLRARMKKAKSNAIRLKWRPVPGATHYVVYGNKCGKKYRVKKLKVLKKTTFVHKKLKEGKYYKYIVVAVKGNKAIATSKVIHIVTSGGKYGNHKAVKVRNRIITLKAGSVSRIMATAVPAKKKLKVRKHRGLAFESSDTNIATVDMYGVVTGIRTGTCYVYVYAQNGVMARVSVIVE